MKLSLAFVVVALCGVLAAASAAQGKPEQFQDSLTDMDYISALEVSQPTPALATYLPTSGVFDNPATDTTPTNTIPSSPSCTIRGQTIFEIRKMRADAKQIGMSIMFEIQTMEKRKAYIEQMTAYLNDRIRELNKVKRDLAAEQKWIELSNQRISELAQREKLIKLQDVMSCIQDETERLQGENGSKAAALAAMSKQAAALQDSIKNIRKNMETITGVDAYGAASSASGAAPAAAAAATAAATTANATPAANQG